MPNDVERGVTAGLVDDIADICRYNAGTILYEHGHKETVQEWGFPFASHWEHITDVIERLTVYIGELQMIFAKL